MRLNDFKVSSIKTAIATKTHVLIDRLIDLCVLWDACHGLFCVFGDFYAPGTQDAEVTKSLVGNALSF